MSVGLRDITCQERNEHLRRVAVFDAELVSNDSTVFILIQLGSSSMMTSNSLMASGLGQESTVPYEEPRRVMCRTRSLAKGKFSLA